MLSKHAIVPPSYNTLHLWNRIGGNWVSPDSNILKRECFHSIPLDVDRDESPPRSDFFLQMYLKIWNEIGLKMNLKEFDSRIGILESIDWLKLIRVIDREESLPRSDFFLQIYLENTKIDLKMNVKEFVENWNPGIGRSSRLKLIRGRDESRLDFFLQIYLEIWE